MPSALGAAALLIYVQASAGGVCRDDRTHLSDLRVRDVRISLPVSLPSTAVTGWLYGSVDKQLAALTNALPIRAGQQFDPAAYLGGMQQISAFVDKTSLRVLQRVRLRVVVPSVESCSADSLSVVYRIYTTDAMAYLSRVVESSRTAVAQTLASSGVAEARRYFVTPLLSYNASRGLAGGARVGLDTKTPLQHVAGAFAGSSKTLDASAVVAGRQDFQNPVLSHAEWQLDYRYLKNSVADRLTTFRASTVAASFLGASRAVQRGAVMLRYAAKIEDGRRQDTLAVTAESVSQPYRALKTALGATFGVGRSQGAVSYGVQRGLMPQPAGLGFTKHLVDLSVRQRFLPAPHSPIQVDLGVSAGWIPSALDRLPALERFYGGNVVPDFLEMPSWKIPAGSLLRSFPQYAFGLAGAGGSFGATQFASVNLTVAVTAWRYPAVPDDLLDDPKLRQGLAFQLRSAATAFVNDCAARTKSFEEVVRPIRSIAAILPSIDAWQEHLASLNLPAPAADSLSDAESTFTDLEDAVEKVVEHPKTAVAVGPARFLSSDDEDTSYVLLEVAAATALAEALDGAMPSEAKVIRDSMQALRKAAQGLPAAFSAVDDLNRGNPTDYQAVVNQLVPLRTAIERAGPVLEALGDIEDEALANLRDAALTDLADSLRKIAAAEAPDSPAELFERLDELLTDWGEVGPSSPRSLLETLGTLQRAIRKAGLSSRASSLDQSIRDVRQAYRTTVSLQHAVSLPPTRACAYSEAGFVVRSADAAFRELNLFQVSPVGIVDVARLSSSGTTSGRRVGLGGGIRFSLATFDVTAAYVVNIGRRPGEGPGAFIFSLGVVDIFR